jgi:hypothetical protein
MKLLEDFVPYFAAEVPGAGEPLMLRVVLDTCIDICEQSHGIRLTLDPITLTADVPDYDVELPSGLALIKVTDAWVDGTSIQRILNPEDMRDSSTLTLTSTSRGQPNTLYFTGGTSFIVKPTPETTLTDGLVMFAAVKPKRDAVSVPDELLNDYAEVVAAGACARLMAMGGNQPFANTQLAPVKLAMYKAGVNRVMVKARLGGMGMRHPRVRIRRI